MSRLIAMFGIAVVFFQGCSDDEEAVEPIVRTVRYVRIGSETGLTSRTFAGIVQSGEESRIGFRVAGIISKLHVKVGDQVDRGAPIAELEGTDYRLQLAEINAALAQARAQSRRSKADYDRTRSLYEAGSASRADLDSARAGYESADLNVKSTQSRLGLTSNQLSYTKLTAPTKGLIAKVPVRQAEQVQAGQEVVTLQSEGDLEVQVGVPGVYIARVEVGAPVSITLTALSGETLSGTISEVGVAGDNAIFPVVVAFNNEDISALRSGMAAEVRFDLQATSSGALYVPSVAVAEDHRGRYIYIVEPDDGNEGFGHVRRREVTTGELTLDGMEITEGVSEGDLVVTAGVTRISDGLRVRVPPSASDVEPSSDEVDGGPRRDSNPDGGR